MSGQDTRRGISRAQHYGSYLGYSFAHIGQCGGMPGMVMIMRSLGKRLPLCLNDLCKVKDPGRSWFGHLKALPHWVS